MNAEPIRIMLVDDHSLVRESWKILLESNPRIKVIADCETSHMALELVSSLDPEIILLDINMTPVNGYLLARQLLEKKPTVKIIGLSVNHQPKNATQMLEAGGKGFITKTSTLDEIIAGIIAVHRGEIYICQEIRRNLPPA